MSETAEDIKLGQLSESTISFNTNLESDPILLLKENGDIFVRGKLVENDKEVVEGMREFLRTQGFIKKLG